MHSLEKRIAELERGRVEVKLNFVVYVRKDDESTLDAIERTASDIRAKSFTVFVPKKGSVAEVSSTQ
jgi:3-phenylpropionate/cinnamic acid dioxygenase small subunit